MWVEIHGNNEVNKLTARFQVIDRQPTYSTSSNFTEADLGRVSTKWTKCDLELSNFSANISFRFLSFTFQPRKTDFSLKSPGTKPSYLQSRLSITSQNTLKRSTSQASAIFLPDSDMFPSTLSLSPSTPRTPLSSMAFLPPDNVSGTIPESPLLEDSEPDYVNIENFPEKEPPPDIPPRKPLAQSKPRAVSVNGDRSSENFTSPVRRQMSMTLPDVPRKPPKSVTLERFPNPSQESDDAPPIPPREPSKGTRRSPPPIPPRISSGHEPVFAEEELANHEDSLPPALPPKSRRSWHS